MRVVVTQIEQDGTGLGRKHRLFVLEAVAQVVAVVAPDGTSAELQYACHEQPPVRDAEGNARARVIVGGLPRDGHLLDG